MKHLVFPALFLLFSRVLQAAEIPVGSPVSDRLFHVARELYGRGLLDRLEYSDIGLVSDQELSSFEAGLKAQFDILRKNYGQAVQTPWIGANLDIVESNRQQTTNSNYVKLFPQINVAFSSKLSATILYRIDGELDNDPRYEGKSWRGIAGFAENATIDYHTADLGIRAGIERLSWGYGSFGNLLFWRQAMSMTMVGLSYRRWIFDFESVIGFLNPVKEELDKMRNDTSFFTSQQRYLAAHSFTIRPFASLSFSLREAVIYGGPGRRFEPAYALPLLWYHGQQLNSRLDDNILGSAGIDYRLKGKLWVYGELLVDDFQVEHKARGDYEPNQIGYLAGGELYDLILAGSTIALEYARVNNWTYNQGRPQNRFMNQNYPLGFPTGPDAEVFDWQMSLWLSSGAKLSYVGSLLRRGEGRIDAPWTNPWLQVDHYSEPFPTGTVERVAQNGLGLLVFWKNRLWGNLQLNFTDISNVANVPGKNRRGWGIAVDLGCKLPPFSRGF